MNIIKAGRREIVKQRNAYVEDYTAKRTRYNEQQQAYRDAKNSHLSNIRDAIIEAIGPDLLKPFGDRIFISVDDEWSGRKYRFTIRYSPESRDTKRYNSTNLYFRGVPFEVRIRVLTNRQSGNEELVTAPELSSISSISAEDYQMLIHEIALFKRIDNIDWTQLIDRACKGVDISEYVTEPNPGSQDTSLFDTKLLDYDIARTQNSDNWLFVYVQRAESFDVYAEGTPCPEVHDYGWMKLVKSSPAYYYFYWLREYSTYDVRHGDGIGVNGNYTLNNLEHATMSHNLCKLKKIYFSIPDNHPLYLTPDELCSREVDYPKTEQSEQP